MRAGGSILLIFVICSTVGLHSIVPSFDVRNVVFWLGLLVLKTKKR